MQPNVTIIDVRGKKEEPKDFLQSYKDQMLSNLMGPSYRSPQTSSTFLNPLQLVTAMTAQQPVDYFS
jgi:hypothetical protein